MKNMDFDVNGMSCGHCVKTITESLKALEGIQGIDVSLPQRKVTVTFDETRVGQEIIKSSIVEAGYEVV